MSDKAPITEAIIDQITEEHPAVNTPAEDVQVMLSALAQSEAQTSGDVEKEQVFKDVMEGLKPEEAARILSHDLALISMRKRRARRLSAETIVRLAERYN